MYFLSSSRCLVTALGFLLLISACFKLSFKAGIEFRSGNAMAVLCIMTLRFLCCCMILARVGCYAFVAARVYRRWYGLFIYRFFFKLMWWPSSGYLLLVIRLITWSSDIIEGTIMVNGSNLLKETSALLALIGASFEFDCSIAAEVFRFRLTPFYRSGNLNLIGTFLGRGFCRLFLR